MKSFAISSVLPFPSINWFSHINKVSEVNWDLAEHFEKMTARNRYEIATSNGRLKMTIPLKNGREQRTTMNDIAISYDENWQRQHWRTLFSAYKRSPFFEHYAPSLEAVYFHKHEKLKDFNLASIHWLQQQIGLNIDEFYLNTYQKEFAENVTDLRPLGKEKQFGASVNFPHYYQLFEERNGFLANLSLLDLLFAEGPYTLSFIQKNESLLQSK